MTEPTNQSQYETTSVIESLIDQAHELAAENLDHPEYLEWEKLEKQSRKELDDLLAASDAFWKITSRIIELRDEQAKP